MEGVVVGNLSQPPRFSEGRVEGKMSIVNLVAAAQTNSPSFDGGHPVAAEYVIFVLLAAMLALVVMMFIRTRAGRSSKH